MIIVFRGVKYDTQQAILTSYINCIQVQNIIRKGYEKHKKSSDLDFGRRKGGEDINS